MVKPRPPTPEQLPVAEKDDVLICEVKLLSGKFESRIQIPLHSSEEAKREFVDSWFSMLQAGLRCSPTKKEANG